MNPEYTPAGFWRWKNFTNISATLNAQHKRTACSCNMRNTLTRKDVFPRCLDGDANHIVKKEVACANQACTCSLHRHASGVPRRCELKGSIMSQGDKSAYTDKQKRKAEHIEKSYKKKGVSQKEAEARAWATVNKDDGGGKKSGSGRKKSNG